VKPVVEGKSLSRPRRSRHSQYTPLHKTNLSQAARARLGAKLRVNQSGRSALDVTKRQFCYLFRFGGGLVDNITQTLACRVYLPSTPDRRLRLLTVLSERRINNLRALNVRRRSDPAAVGPAGQPEAFLDRVRVAREALKPPIEILKGEALEQPVKKAVKNH
jgi:hypothetical protein